MSWLLTSCGNFLENLIKGVKYYSVQLNLLNYNLDGMVHQTWTPWIDKKRDKVDPDKSLGLYM